MELTVYTKDGEEAGKIEVPPEISEAQINAQLLHDAVVMYLANRRQGTHCTKTRAEVSGGGRKPWRQKGTGRARHGSIRSPIWRHGGIAHGPKPRDYYYRLPKKMLRNAFRQALASKIRDQEVRVVTDLKFEKPKTKEMVAVLTALGIERSCLICVAQGDENAYLSGRNIAKVDVVRWQDANTYDLLSHKYVLVSREALERLFERVCAQKVQHSGKERQDEV